MTRGSVRVAVLAAVLAHGAPGTAARAQSGTCTPAGERPAILTVTAEVAGRWPAPLDRPVTLAGEWTTLGAALEHIAATAPLRLSYSPELLPLARRVCAGYVARPAGEVLVDVLAGTGAVPVLAGGDLVVLAPGRVAAGQDAAPPMARSTGRLERVLVTGTAAGGPERASPHSVTVLDDESLPRAGVVSLSALLDGAAPGMWTWTQSPGSALARFGSVRGASSFGVTTPKVYLDGVELANPLALTQLDATLIERVEVIRGPQGAALYGPDALSGVVNIVTSAGPGDRATTVRASVGRSQADFADGGVTVQEHGVVARRGSGARSLALGLSANTVGAWLPEAGSRQALATATARRVTQNLVATGTLRMHATDADVGASPLLQSVLRGTRFADSASSQRLRHVTVGGSLVRQASTGWLHTLTAGLDGYRLSGLSAEGMPLPSATDSAMRAASGGTDRASLRASATRRLPAGDGRALAVTFGGEHSAARQRTRGAFAPSGSGAATAQEDVTVWSRNTGWLTQLQASVDERLYLTVGARLERMSGTGSIGQYSLLPMFGGSWITGSGPLVVKVRTAYGRGIRQPHSTVRGGSWMDGRIGGTWVGLDPEEQAGAEWGADVFVGSRATLGFTRFHQRAAGLAQAVPVLIEDEHEGTDYPDRVVYVLQTVGAISNDGWEMQGSARWGALRVAASLARVSSVVARLAAGYEGDLQLGDRMLEVPARTAGVTASWTGPRLGAMLTLSRAADWINYDKLALAQAFMADTTSPPVGAELRDFWRGYGAVTRVAVRGSWLMRGRWSLTFAGENLLDEQRGEPDDVTVLPGRTLRLGVSATF